MLVNCEVADVDTLFEAYRSNMYDPKMRSVLLKQDRRLDTLEDKLLTEIFDDIEQRLHKLGYGIENFFHSKRYRRLARRGSETNRLIREDSYDVAQMREENNSITLNTAQKAVFDEVIASVENKSE